MTTLFDGVSIALSLVADAIRVLSKHRSEASQWKLERQFCLDLRATLDSAKAWCSSDGGFSHDQELNILIQATFEPLLTMYDALEPYINDLRHGCEDDAYRKNITILELTLRHSVMGLIKGLRTRISELVRRINFLLLLFIMYVVSFPFGTVKLTLCLFSDCNISSRPHIVFAHQFAEMQALKLRAKITDLPELDRVAEPYSIKTWSNEEEQHALKMTRKNIVDDWDMAQVAVYRKRRKSGYIALSSTNLVQKTLYC